MSSNFILDISAPGPRIPGTALVAQDNAVVYCEARFYTEVLVADPADRYNFDLELMDGYGQRYTAEADDVDNSVEDESMLK